MKRTIAAFDFDGTITRKDTFLDFATLSFGARKVYFTLLKHSLGLLTKDKGEVKEAVFADLFKGMDYALFKTYGEQYALTRVPMMLNEKVMKRLLWHQQQGHEVVVVSASVCEWIAPWAQAQHIHTVLSTEVEVENGVLTGRFSTPNCKKEEKVRRLQAFYPDRKNLILYAYGNSSDDEAMLSYADYGVRVDKE